MPAKSNSSSIRTLALDPLLNFKHELISVTEWSDAKVIVRALSAGDWVEYRRRALELVQENRLAKIPNDSAVVDELGNEGLNSDISSASLYAFVMGRTLFDPSGQRVFTDDDIEEIGKAFSPVHDRLVCKAFELSGVQVGTDSPDPVAAAGNV